MAALTNLPRVPRVSSRQTMWSCFNRPFPSSLMPPLQNESKCEVFLMKISFHSNDQLT